MTNPFGSVLTAMITPFSPDGSVDYGCAARLAVHLADNGSDGVLLTGTTGESPTLSGDEKAALYATVAEAVGGRAAVVAGTGTYDTRYSVDMSRRAEAAGADGIMAVTPYYSRPPQRGLIAHFRAVADATDLPLIVYNIPGRTARLIEVETLAEIARHPQVAAVKDAVEDVEFTRVSREALPDDVVIYSGTDSVTLPLMEVGAAGVISVASHFAGRRIKDMVEAFAAGDRAEAQRLHEGLMPLFEACFIETNPIPTRAGLTELWEPVGDPRPPLVAAYDSTRRAVVAAAGLAQAL